MIARETITNDDARCVPDVSQALAGGRGERGIDLNRGDVLRA